MIEKVKEILKEFDLKLAHIDDPYITKQSGTYTDKLIDKFAQQICQQFPKTPKNPDGYKPKIVLVIDPKLVKNVPKPDEWFTEERIKGAIAREEVYKEYNESLKLDESRLLTVEEFTKALKPLAKNNVIPIAIGKVDKAVMKAQRDLTSSIIRAECQARVRANLTLLVAEIQDCKDTAKVNQLLDCWIKANNLKPEEVKTYDSLDEFRQALKEEVK